MQTLRCPICELTSHIIVRSEVPGPKAGEATCSGERHVHREVWTTQAPGTAQPHRQTDRETNRPSKCTRFSTKQDWLMWHCVVQSELRSSCREYICVCDNCVLVTRNGSLVVKAARCSPQATSLGHPLMWCTRRPLTSSLTPLPHPSPLEPMVCSVSAACEDDIRYNVR